jgi:hypothetical protein
MRRGRQELNLISIGAHPKRKGAVSASRLPLKCNDLAAIRHCAMSFPDRLLDLWFY